MEAVTTQVICTKCEKCIGTLLEKREEETGVSPTGKEVPPENERERLLEEIKKLQNENQRLAQDNQMKVLEIDRISKEKETLLRTRNDLVEEERGWLKLEQKHLEEECQRRNNEIQYFRRENSELKEWKMIAEIQTTLLTDLDLLDKFGWLKWTELSPTMQGWLLRKVQVNGRPFMKFDKILPINLKALMRMMRAGENDETLLQKLVEDYYEEMEQLHGKVFWHNLDDSLRVYVTSKMGETSLESLELDQVPLSSSTLVHLIKEKTENNPGYLGKMVTSYVDEMVTGSLSLMNDLFKVALLELINKEVIGCVEVHFLDPQGLERLVEAGMLRKGESEFESPYEFSHDSVWYCIIGTIMSELGKRFKMSRMNVFQLFHESYTSVDPLSFYFADYMSDVEQSYLSNFNFDEMFDDTLTSLIMVLCVMRLPSLESVIAVLNHSNIDVQNIVLTRKVPFSDDLTFTLLHAAAIKGDLERMNCLLYEFGFSEELTNPCFRNLMRACVENTKECTDEQIQERKEIFFELRRSKLYLSDCDPLISWLNVNDDLIQYMLYDFFYDYDYD